MSRTLLLVALLLAGCSGTRPTDLGVRGGRFKSCPLTPNCVNSQAPADDVEHYVEPLRFAGEWRAAKERLLAVLAELPRMEVIVLGERYLHVEATSFFWRFVDDVEFFFPEDEPLVHVRSASRLGRSDLGVNRDRIETIREQFEGEPKENED